MENHTTNELEVDEFLDCVDYIEELKATYKEGESRPAISLHVMLAGYQIMRIKERLRTN